MVLIYCNFYDIFFDSKFLCFLICNLAYLTYF